jgi:DNA-methyltransferase (dcm)
MDKKPNIVDLFCGAGGLSYGFEQAGFRVLLGIDNDATALKTFKANHKGAKAICGDITNITYRDIKKVVGDKKIDVVIGGPPCQGFSLSGPRNFNDPRNVLYLSYIRLVNEIRPEMFVIENVPGLIRLFNGQVKDKIIETFQEMGYEIRYRILTASDYGVPQKRNRVVFVGNKPGHVFSYPKKHSELVTCEMALSDLPALADNDYLGEDRQNYPGEPLNGYQKTMRQGSKAIFNHVAAHHDERVRSIIDLVPPGKNYKALPEDIKSKSHFHVAWTRFPDNAPAPTIDTGHRHHFHYKYNRVPTVRECARLQSFPDRFVFQGNKTQQFRQVGNAVPPLMAVAIASEILKSLKGQEENYVQGSGPILL